MVLDVATAISSLLILHSAWRWIVLVSAATSVARALQGWAAGRQWTAGDRWSALIFVGALDIQLTLGLLLLSVAAAATRVAFAPHVAAMIAVVVLAHAGKVLASRAERPQAQQRLSALFSTPAFALMLAAIPWGRPLLR